jgi:hypothetical protein
MYLVGNCRSTRVCATLPRQCSTIMHSIGPGVVHIAQAGSQPDATSGTPVLDPKAAQTNTNVTTGWCRRRDNDTPFTRTVDIMLSLRCWATGEAVQS